jgi:hypothetical protein
MRENRRFLHFGNPTNPRVVYAGVRRRWPRLRTDGFLRYVSAGSCFPSSAGLVCCFAFRVCRFLPCKPILVYFAYHSDRFIFFCLCALCSAASLRCDHTGAADWERPPGGGGHDVPRLAVLQAHGNTRGRADARAGAWPGAAVRGLAAVAERCLEHRAAARATSREVLPQLKKLKAMGARAMAGDGVVGGEGEKRGWASRLPGLLSSRSRSSAAK